MDNRAIEEVRRNEDRLIERIEYLERSNNRREETIIYLREESIDFETRIDNAIEYIKRFDFERLNECMEHNLVEALENLLEILKGVKYEI